MTKLGACNPTYEIFLGIFLKNLPRLFHNPNLKSAESSLSYIVPCPICISLLELPQQITTSFHDLKQ